MKQRCYNKKHKAFRRYGGRGISVAPAWMDFLIFIKDMGKRPDGCSLERIDNGLGYSKKNCKWATFFQQNNNRSSNRLIFLYGQKYTLIQVSRKYGIEKNVLKYRLDKKWDIRDAILKPTRPVR